MLCEPSETGLQPIDGSWPTIQEPPTYRLASNQWEAHYGVLGGALKSPSLSVHFSLEHGNPRYSTCLYWPPVRPPWESWRINWHYAVNTLFFRVSILCHLPGQKQRNLYMNHTYHKTNQSEDNYNFSLGVWLNNKDRKKTRNCLAVSRKQESGSSSAPISLLGKLLLI